MQAVVTQGTGEAAVEEVERPSPDAGEVLLDVRQFQLSVTECWMYQGRLPMLPELEARMEAGDRRAFGHEFCAEVVELGEGVEEFSVGDRVYGPGKIHCGECPYCENDWETLCENSETIGLGTYPGAAAEYFVAPAGPLCAVPDEISDGEAAALQPLSDALGRVHDADISTGDVVAVVGAGVMGNQCGQLAATLGASDVYAVDIDPEKLRIAEKLGMTGVDSTEVDPVEAVEARTEGMGPDVVVSAVGGDQSHLTDGNDPAAQAMRMVRTGGTYVQVGILTSDELSFDPSALMRSSVDIVYPQSYGGIRDRGPNRDAGEHAAHLVATGRVSIDQFVDIELDGLDDFDRMVEITSNKDEHDTLGPAQISV